MHDKLLTLKEAAQFLGVPEQDLVQRTEEGKIPGYKIGGVFWRYDLRDLVRMTHADTAADAGVTETPSPFPADDLSPQIATPPSSGERSSAEAGTSREQRGLDRESIQPRSDGRSGEERASFSERVLDFLYLHDFYLVSFLLLCAILAVIWRL